MYAQPRNDRNENGTRPAVVFEEALTLSTVCPNHIVTYPESRSCTVCATGLGAT